LLLAELWREGSDITRVLRKSDTKAAINKNSATTRVQEHAEVPLFAEVRNVAGDAREVSSVILEADAADSGATVKYRLVLSAGSVSESDDVLEAPLELIAECVYSVLDLQRLLDEKPVSLEERVEASEDGFEAALENDYAVRAFKSRDTRNGAAA
jgi:hypothetical protein